MGSRQRAGATKTKDDARRIACRLIELTLHAGVRSLEGKISFEIEDARTGILSTRSGLCNGARRVPTNARDVRARLHRSAVQVRAHVLRQCVDMRGF